MTSALERRVQLRCPERQRPVQPEVCQNHDQRGQPLCGFIRPLLERLLWTRKVLNVGAL